MVVSNKLFDLLLFGALLLGLALDAAIPALEGTAFLLACGLAVYMAAQEWSEALARRRLWTQEPLSTAVALSSGGFIYFYLRNQSDFVLLVLSIGLMMASLMVAIATMGAFGAVFKQRSPAPLVGYLATVAGTFAMGALAGIITLEAPPVAKMGVVVISLALWKLREALAPPQSATPDTPDASVGMVATDAAKRAAQTAANAALATAGLGGVLSSEGRWQLIPKRGTLLDRFLPVLLIGGLMILGARQSKPFLQSVAPPASANSNAAPQ